MGVDCGKATSAVCLLASILTLIVGVIHLILAFKDLRLHFSECEFVDDDCNRGWRSVFTFNPVIMLDLWTPFILGVIGICIHTRVMRFELITSMLAYFVFMLITCLFGNFGYTSQFGIIVGAISLLGAFMCLVTFFAESKSVRTLDIGPSSV